MNNGPRYGQPEMQWFNFGTLHIDHCMSGRADCQKNPYTYLYTSPPKFTFPSKLPKVTHHTQNIMGISPLRKRKKLRSKLFQPRRILCKIYGKKTGTMGFWKRHQQNYNLDFFNYDCKNCFKTCNRLDIIHSHMKSKPDIPGLGIPRTFAKYPEKKSRKINLTHVPPRTTFWKH